MKDTIYIPFILTQPRCIHNFVMKMIPKLNALKTPEGISLVDIQIKGNQLFRHLLDRLEKINEDNVDYDVFFTVPEYFMEISFDTAEPIHCKSLPWLEEQIDSIFLDVVETATFFYAYLVDDGRCFRTRNIVRVETEDDKVKVLKDIAGDDLSPLQEDAAFIAHLYYGKNVDEAFPDKVAKYYLFFE